MAAASVLFVGGTRSGKSACALAWAQNQAPRRLFVATARVEDEEMTARVERHRRERGAGWQLAEESLDPLRVLRAAEEGEHGAVGVVLLDCVSIWLSNLMFADLDDQAILARVDGLCAHLASGPRLAVGMVTSETGMGIVPATALGRRYRDLLGMANQKLARACTQVVLVSVGLPLALKGTLPEGI